MYTIFDAVMIPLQLLIVFFTLYYFVISLFGFWRKKEEKILEPRNRFAIVVAAHNEKEVIGQLVENLQVLDYPRDLYDVYVIADNCNDNTAEIARQAGAIVHERENKELRGKGYALEWMFEKLYDAPQKYDAVVVFDADNLVHPAFLREMNNRLCKGERIIQGYLDAKNPNDTWVAGTFAIAFWVVNHIWHLAKYNIGLTSVLGGTGMCISMSVLKQFGWGATSLTEDMEFTMKALVKGIPTTWAHEAIVYDEKPLTFKQSWNQRRRWAQGHFDVAGRYIPQLIRQGFRNKDFRMLDGVFHLFQPYFLLLSTWFVISTYIYQFIPFYTNILYDVLPMQVWSIIAIGQYVFPILVLLQIRVSWKAWFHLILYPIFIYSWIPITFIGFLHRNRREWSHTKHTRALTYQEVVAAGQNQYSKENVLSKQAIK